MKLGGYIEAAVEALLAGGVVLSPTETVVGLLAAEPGLKRIIEIKGREPGKPVALLCATAEDALALGESASPLALELSRLYWPGPLTLVLKRAEGGTIGVRVPDHAIIQRLLAAYGSPIYATSANLSGEPAPRSLENVDSSLRESVAVILEAEGGDGAASAVVDLTGQEPYLIRPGVELTEEKLTELAEECGHS